MTEATISLADPQSVLSLFGTRDRHVRRIREAFAVEITHRDGQIRVAGESAAVARATKALEQLKDVVQRRGSVDESQVDQILGLVTSNQPGLLGGPIEVFAASRKIVPRSEGQRTYVQAIRDFDLVFALGPSGTGKTYLAVALAVEALKRKLIRKIVLVRPAVEAGESLGFLPGDLQAKINPYLRPLLDALHEMMDYDQFRRFMDEDVIEVVPLAYMRGRTLNDAFIILDEAQNTTVAQMKMFLTRMGAGSKIVVAGDATQLDLPPHARSGLKDACYRLRDIEGFCQVDLRKEDIVRHPLVQRIVQAYEDGPRPALRSKRKPDPRRPS
ncbi:MAG: PhoH family protein [Pirellulales bacterium]